jgi:hypothetical protein
LTGRLAPASMRSLANKKPQPEAPVAVSLRTAALLHLARR